MALAAGALTFDLPSSALMCQHWPRQPGLQAVKHERCCVSCPSVVLPPQPEQAGASSSRSLLRPLLPASPVLSHCLLCQPVLWNVSSLSVPGPSVLFPVGTAPARSASRSTHCLCFLPSSEKSYSFLWDKGPTWGSPGPLTPGRARVRANHAEGVLERAPSM